MTRRLFFAIWPDDEVRAKLAALAAEVTPTGVRPVLTRNLHLTLVFLGAMSADEERRACAAAQTVRFQPFEIELNRIGHFARAGALWSGPPVPCAPLHELKKALDTALERHEVGTREDTYREHVTLARKVKHLGTREAHDSIRWRVDAFNLVHSRPCPGGVVYEPVQLWPSS